MKFLRIRKPLPLGKYAERQGISYQTAWRHLRKKVVSGKKLKNGQWVILRQEKPVKKGRPQTWSKEKVIQEVYKLCRGRYVKAEDFPPALYKLCRRYCGSVRAAKWEAKIIHGRQWTKDKFLKCVRQYCARRYRDENRWPPNLKRLAKIHCGSVRKAKWEAGVIEDNRQARRSPRRNARTLWSRKELLRWVSDFCRESYLKPAYIPGHMRALLVRQFGTVRAAKYAAGVLKNVRGDRR